MTTLTDLTLTGAMLGIPFAAQITREGANHLRVKIRPTCMMDSQVGAHADGHLVDMRDTHELYEAAMRLQYALRGIYDRIEREKVEHEYFELLMTFTDN